MRNFPTLIFPFLLYNVFAFLIFPTYGADFEWTLAEFTMVSGVRFGLTVGTVIIVLSLILLGYEVVRAARITHSSVADHIWATVLLIVFLLEFLFIDKAATSTFFILTALSAIDLVTGFSVSIKAAHRDMTLDV
jgi:hypothetical protein